MPAESTPRTTAAIIGGGVSGLTTARALQAAGLAVTIFEKEPDLGGVWSASRAYPSISTQDDRSSYAFSDLPMQGGSEPHPDGAEVRAYLEQYARTNGLDARLRLSTTVTEADAPADGGWRISSDGPAGPLVEEFDWLVAANGVFSKSHVPAWPGRDEFEAAGGVIVTPSELGDGAVLDDRRTVVVGWGKTSCDIAAIAASRSSRTEVIARTLTWKYPKHLGLGGLTFRHLVLTRAGERLIGTSYRTADGRVMLRRIPERIPRLLLGRLLGRAVDRTTGVSALGLRSTMEFRSSTSLVTEGFFEAVRDGHIRVRRGQSVAALGSDAAGPWVQLTDGSRIPADVVVAATGYEREAGFFSPRTAARLRGDDDVLRLHRAVLAVDVPHLAFIGWTQSYRSPLTSEVTSLWLAGVLLGLVPLPDEATMRSGAERVPLDHVAAERLGGVLLPSLKLQDLDALLREIGLRLPVRARLRQVFSPVDPADYAGLLAQLIARADAPRREREPADAGRATG